MNGLLVDCYLAHSIIEIAVVYLVGSFLICNVVGVH